LTALGKSVGNTSLVVDVPTANPSLAKRIIVIGDSGARKVFYSNSRTEIMEGKA